MGERSVIPDAERDIGLASSHRAHALLDAAQLCVERGDSRSRLVQLDAGR
jgi:hypothetical protein